MLGLMAITKAEGKTKVEGARGDADTHKALAVQIAAELGGGANKELVYRALRGDTTAALALAATLPT